VWQGGLRSLTKALAIELAPHAVRVDAVATAREAPPYLRQFPEEEHDLTEDTFTHPLGWIGTPEDAAKHTAVSTPA
jgi:NAD(P)-dependent dehydrogenase (short-subunit alcohol dehydrogenase family)